MSRETNADLQRNFLIGNCKARPRSRAWHYDSALQQQLGLEDNHYDDPIPFKEVVRRLFSWKPVRCVKANLVPCGKADANWFYDNMPVRVSPTPEDEIGIVRDDTGEHIATHGPRYQIHDYEEWLLRLQQTIIGDTLVILGAGLPRRGAQAYVQVMLPETAFDEKTGLKFLPYIMGSTSLDGSIPTTYGGQSLLVVCDNTRDMALRESQRANRVYKAKHTAKSLDDNRIRDVRDALGIIHRTAEATIDEFHLLASIPITKTQVQKVWDIIIPIPDVKDSKRGYTVATNKQEALNTVYWKDPMMNNMQGTALGVVQAVNTYQTHYATVRGAARFERNMDRAIRGQWGDLDMATVDAIAAITDHPKLAVAN